MHYIISHMHVANYCTHTNFEGPKFCCFCEWYENLAFENSFLHTIILRNLVRSSNHEMPNLCHLQIYVIVLF